MTAPWRLTVVAGEQCAPERWTTASQRLRQRRCFGPRCRMPSNAFTNKEEVFTWAKNNNQRLLHVDDIDRTSKRWMATAAQPWQWLAMIVRRGHV
ncbi:hypothetical protein OsI_22449 [Oryza sativa Indica Group]|uniref:Uncharacterized protein n=1 Tax=Oryza sativa subsp. indica TaxID=39946 RepID=A2YBG5_ORYSI|nr:hypothetical protein OsI_22449 [Oryza sativa Indica Group]